MRSTATRTRDCAALSDEALAAKSAEFKEGLAAEETLEDLLPEAFAVAREMSLRKVGERPYDVQLMGGITLHEGRIAEMRTGEGKTLTAISPVYLNALAGRGVHVITVIDYLARRDATWYGPIYAALGMTVGVIQNNGVSYMYEPGYRPARKAQQAASKTSGPCSRQRCLPRRHHLRHEQRARVRLPARQHGPRTG
ncbi:hypothetical protein [Candidatus Amarobacter glycogenicus]|uniref:hypothetical protein n=1 Tax=Candidatus Amarobacter glycogenicus TaxID=3140699 RepID=UPI0031CC961D